MNPKKLLVGITGGIGSGKSSVAAAFAELGATIIDADSIAHEILAPGTPAYRRITRAFGGKILNPDMTISRRALAQIVFAGPAKRKLLERITHPVIISRILSMARKAGAAMVMVDAPLLYETRLDRRMDKVIAVWCPLKIRIKRLSRAGAPSGKEIRSRIKAQMPLREKIKRADMVINNAHSRSRMRKDVKRAWWDLTNNI